MKKRLSAIFVALCLCLTLLPTAALADGENGLGDSENGLNDAALNAAVNAMVTALNPVETVISTDTAWSEAKTLSGNLTVNSGVTLTIGEKVTISGNVTVSGGGTIKRGTAYTKTLISVPEGTSLTLQNITIDGGAVWSGDNDETLGRGTTNNGVKATDAAVRVDGGTLLLNSSAVIQNNDNTNLRDNHYYHSAGWRYYSCGGGVAIYNGGTVTMKSGAAIKNNSITNSGYTKATSEVSFSEDITLNKEGNSHSFGGGVGIYESGTFTMSGGTISGNSAYKPAGDGAAYGGGVGLLSRGADSDHTSCNKADDLLASFVMNGGQIINNYATSGGGGVRAADDQGDDKSDRKAHSTIAVNGGEISSNSTGGAGGGILIYYATLNISGTAKISGNKAESYGGGIEVSSHSNLTMTGGAVSNNVSSSLGGAIHDNGADVNTEKTHIKTHISISNVTFSSNQATSGGAVYCKDSVVSITDCTFSENRATAENSGGGAICNSGNGLTINNCTISENTASGKGGGIYASESFSLKNTSVTANSASNDGGGIYINEKELAISGKVIVKDNTTNSSAYSSNNVFLDHVTNGAVIKKSGDLAGSEIYFGLSSYYYDDSNSNHVDVKVLSGGDDNAVLLTDVMYMYCDANGYAPYFDSADGTIKVSSAVTITFDANYGETAQTSTQKVASGKTTALENNTFERVGYTFTGWNTSSSGESSGMPYANGAEINISSDTTLYAQWALNTPSSSSSSGGSSSSNTTTSTVKNPDGSSTTTTTNKTTGTTTEVTKNTDGSVDTVITNKDGSTTESTKTAGGTTATVETNKNGDTTSVSASVSSTDAKSANKSGDSVSLPLTGVTPAASSDEAQTIDIDVPSNVSSVTVEIPVEDVTPGTVVIIVNKDGTETVVPTSTVTENGIEVTLTEDATIKIVDNSKTFNDVPESNVFHDEIAAMSARGIMVGKTDDTFDVYGDVTLNQIVNVAGRVSGAVATEDYEGGVAWGEANGLATGDTPATRGQVILALYVAAGSPDAMDTGKLSAYSDGASVPSELLSAVLWAVENGILKGTDAGTLDLGSNVTRGQAAAFAGRTLGVIG